MQQILIEDRVLAGGKRFDGSVSRPGILHGYGRELSIIFEDIRIADAQADGFLILVPGVFPAFGVRGQVGKREMGLRIRGIQSFGGAEMGDGLVPLPAFKYRDAHVVVRKRRIRIKGERMAPQCERIRVFSTLVCRRKREINSQHADHGNPREEQASKRKKWPPEEGAPRGNLDESTEPYPQT